MAERYGTEGVFDSVRRIEGGQDQTIVALLKPRGGKLDHFRIHGSLRHKRAFPIACCIVQLRLKVEGTCVPIDIDAKMGEPRRFVQDGYRQPVDARRFLRQVEQNREWVHPSSGQAIRGTWLKARPIFRIVALPNAIDSVGFWICVVDSLAAKFGGGRIELADLPFHFLLGSSTKGAKRMQK